MLKAISKELNGRGEVPPAKAEEYGVYQLQRWLKNFENRLRSGLEYDFREITKGTEYRYLRNIARSSIESGTPKDVNRAQR